MADTETTVLKLKKRGSGDGGDWAPTHNDSMDRIDERLSKQGSGTPVGVVTPVIIGQRYVDIATGDVWTSTGLTDADWTNVRAISSVWEKSQFQRQVALASVANQVLWDGSLGNYLKLTLTENTVLQLPTAIPTTGGQHVTTYVLQVDQDPSTPFTFTFASGFKASFGAFPTMPTTLSARHIYSIMIDSAGSPIVQPLFDVKV